MNAPGVPINTERNVSQKPRPPRPAMAHGPFPGRRMLCAAFFPRIEPTTRQASKCGQQFVISVPLRASCLKPALLLQVPGALFSLLYFPPLKF